MLRKGISQFCWSITMTCVIFNEKCIKPLPKCALVHLGLMTPVSTTDAAIQKKMFGSSNNINDIMKVFKS